MKEPIEEVLNVIKKAGIPVAVVLGIAGVVIIYKSYLDIQLTKLQIGYIEKQSGLQALPFIIK